MSKMKLLIPACFIAFFACSCSEKVTGTTEDENTVVAQGDSSSSEDTPVSEPVEQITGSSSSSATSSSNKEISLSSSDTNPGTIPGGFGGGGIEFPPDRQCAAAAPARKAVYGVVDAFIQQRVATLEGQGLSHDAAKDSATVELYRELGLDTLFQVNPRITDEQLEYTLFYLYKNQENDSINEMSPALVNDFADGTLEPENYCINELPYAELNNLPFVFLPLGCVYGEEVPNSLSIIRNIWRKCSGMPFCNADMADTLITIGKDHFVCENSSWITLEMQGKEMNGIICTENGMRTIGVGETNNDLTYICVDEYWKSILHTQDLPAEYFFNPDFEYGTFTDPRDGHVYKTTVYEGQTWLAQDMDYYDSSDTLFVNQSRCAKNVGYREFSAEENGYCDGASRFYTVNVSKKVCPEGWRLPKKDDWLINGIGYNSALTTLPKFYVIGSFIRGKDRATTDEYGLSLRMDGGIDPYGRDMTLTGYNLFWLEEGVYTENGDLFSNFSNVDIRENGEYVPVRCVKK